MQRSNRGNMHKCIMSTLCCYLINDLIVSTCCGCCQRHPLVCSIVILNSSLILLGEIVLNNRMTALHRFNFDDVDAANAKIVAAELRLKAPDSPRGMLFAYQLLEGAKTNHNTAKKLLRVWRLGESTNASTMILNMTSLAKEWLHSSYLNHGIEIELQYEASAPQVLPASPLLVLYMSSSENYQYTMEETRQKRHVPSKRQTPGSSIDVQAIYATEAPPATQAPSGTLPCHVDEIVLTTEEIGLQDVIYAPSLIRFTFCSGHCHWPFPQNVSATNAGRIQGRVAVLSGKVPQPCCAPKEYSSERYLFRKGPTRIQSDLLPQSKVLSCECK